MRKNIQKVLSAFNVRQSAAGDSKKTCWTDGTTLYSYAMPIAWWDAGKVKVIAYTDAPSRTTKSQVRACQIFFNV
jgi:hypothetical protein